MESNGILTLLDLIDDVLLHTFKYLNFGELYSVACTCVRLNEIVRTSISRNYRKFEYMENLETCDFFYVNDEAADIAFTNIMKFIGPHITTLHLNGSSLLRKSFPSYTNNHEEYRATYEHEVAVGFVLHDFPRYDQLWPLVEMYFTNLMRVDIDFDGDGRPFNIDTSHLRTLYITGFRTDDKFLLQIGQHWPIEALFIAQPDMSKGSGGETLEWNAFSGKFLTTLERLHVLGLHRCTRVKPQNVFDFCQTNSSTMTHLVLNDCTQLNASRTIFPCIARYLTLLEFVHLQFSDVTPNLMCLANLKNLQCLSLNMADNIEDLLVNLTNHDQLSSLHLIDCTVYLDTELFSGSSSFFQLTELNLDRVSVSSDILLRFASKRLKKIDLCYNEELSDSLLQLIGISEELHYLGLDCDNIDGLDAVVEGIVEVLRNISISNRPKLLFRLQIAKFSVLDGPDPEVQQFLRKLNNVYEENRAILALETIVL